MKSPTLIYDASAKRSILLNQKAFKYSSPIQMFNHTFPVLSMGVERYFAEVIFTKNIDTPYEKEW